MYLPQDSGLNKDAENRKPQKQRQVCLTPTEELDSHWDPAPAWAGPVLWHVLRMQDIKKFETMIQKANSFKYFMARNVI